MEKYLRDSPYIIKVPGGDVTLNFKCLRGLSQGFHIPTHLRRRIRFETKTVTNNTNRIPQFTANIMAVRLIISSHVKSARKAEVCVT